MSKKLLVQINNYLCVIIGTLILAFGSVIFLSECELVAGGISGIGIIVNHFIANSYDIVAAIATVLCWFLGLFIIGKDFAMKTLLSSVLYIGYTFLFKRVDYFTELAKTFAGTIDGNATEVGNYILCAVFGGVFVGGGVALTFVGGGSTGGVDVFQLILKKYLGIKESIGSFLIDGVVIVVGIFSLGRTMLIASLCGILSSFVTAVLIEIVYIKSQSSYQIDIISDKWEEISRYAQDVLERGATIIHANGGYKGEERVILRVVFDRTQYDKIRSFIADIDPNAFITITQTNAVYGEGFNKHRKSIKKKKK